MPISRINTAGIADSAITTAKVANDAVTGAKIPAGAVDTTELAADAVTTAKVADDTIGVAQMNVPFGRRNMIINGAQIVTQRGTSFTGITSGMYATDRWNCRVGSLGTYTVTQETDAPANTGLTKSLKIACTAADSDGSNGAFNLAYHFEGQNLQHLMKGTSNAVKTTLSFWAKADAAEIIQVNLRDTDNTRHIGNTVTLGTSWTKHTLTFDGDTTDAFDNDNGDSMWIEWWLGYGSSDSTYTGGSVPTSWASESANNRAAGNTFNIGSSTSKTFQITGVQFEVGDTASNFEHRSFGEELALCQRYYWKPVSQVYCRANGYSINGRYFGQSLTPPVPMRANPSVTLSNISYADANTAVAELTNADMISFRVVAVGDASNFAGFNIVADAEL